MTLNTKALNPKTEKPKPKTYRAPHGTWVSAYFLVVNFGTRV